MRFRFLILPQLAQINNRIRKKKRNIQFQSFSSPMFYQSYRFLAITMRIEMNNDKKKKKKEKEPKEKSTIYFSPRKYIHHQSHDVQSITLLTCCTLSRTYWRLRYVCRGHRDARRPDGETWLAVNYFNAPKASNVPRVLFTTLGSPRCSLGQPRIGYDYITA